MFCVRTAARSSRRKVGSPATRPRAAPLHRRYFLRVRIFNDSVALLLQLLTYRVAVLLVPSFCSLYQMPRSEEWNRIFKLALPAMNQFYASAVSTTVLQIKE